MAQLVSEGRQAKINKSAFLQPTNNIIQQSDNMVKATCSRNFQAESIVCRDSVEWAEFLHSLSYSELAISQQNILLHHSLLKGFCRASGDMHTEEIFSSKANAFFSYPAKQRAGRFESGSYDRARLGETTSVQTRRRDRHVTGAVCPTDNASGTLCLLESCPDTLCKENLGLSSATVLQPDLSVFGGPFSFFQRLSSFPQQLAFNPYASFLNSGGGGSLWQGTSSNTGGWAIHDSPQITTGWNWMCFKYTEVIKYLKNNYSYCQRKWRIGVFFAPTFI